MDLWEATLFGLPRVRFGERSVDQFHTRQAALLFAYLVIHPRRHLRDELVDLLWPDADPESGRPRLSQAIWRIRQTLRELGPNVERDILISDRNTVSVDFTLITSDVAEFRQLRQRAEKLEGMTRVEALEKAAALHGDTGGFLSGFYDDWVLSERQRLLTDYLSALDGLASHYEKMGEWKRASELAERAVDADPLLEDSHRALIRILAVGGQTAAAERQYGNLTRMLARDLNTEPSSATRALMTQIRQEADTVSAPPRSAASAHTLLRVTPPPASLTTLYGREAILSEVGSLLDDPETRLITLLGTGGIGKTRLALELARRAAAHSTEPAVAMVFLADIAEPSAVAEAIAVELTPVREGPPLPRIVDALTAAPDTPPFLLVLDNAEHLAEAVGAFASDLLARIPRLRVLVTSQRSLGVSGEHQIMLTPLGLPRARQDAASAVLSSLQAQSDLENAPSVQLFLDRAKSVLPSFPTDAARMADVAQICERLEGLPLAIELCAGWAQTLGTRQMLDMLERRFELLVTRRTDIPARHRTLRAAIEYSYLQLSETMQESFIKLAVFRNGWTLAAGAEICMEGSASGAMAMLAQMRERSLIAADEARVGDGMRYKMLESLRDFALEQRTMAKARQHDKAHADYFARFVLETVPRMHGQEAALWAVRLDDEMENIRAALEHLTSSGAIEQTWTVVAAVSKAWNAHGHARESRQWIARALTMDGVALNEETDGSERGLRLQRLRARLLTIQVETLRVLSDFTASAASAEQALAIWSVLGDAAGMTECIGLMGVTAMLHDEFDRAQELLAQALPLARTLGDPNILAQTLNDLGRIAMALQDWPAALERLTEGLELRRRIGDTRLVCSSLSNLGLVYRYQGDYAAARVLLQEAVSLQNQQKIVWYSSLGLNLASVERLDGRYSESLSLLRITIVQTRASGERRVVAWCLKEMGHLAIALQQYALGLRLLSCAETMRAALGMSFKPLGPQDIGRDRAAAEQALGMADAVANWTVGASTGSETLLAQAQTTLAEVLNSHNEKK
ncbi:MAG: putative ATPase [Capsulimonas sp.]|nr:putative ATPase [Capsulimonas sp.]